MAEDTDAPPKPKKPEAEQEEEEDPRLEFMFNYIMRSLRIKPDKWVKLLQSKDFGKYVTDFLVNPQLGKIIFAVNPTGLLIPSYDFPTTAKAKSCYFIRKVPAPILKDNFRDVLMFGDISAKPVDELSVLVQEVFVPLLSNPMNQRNWPQIVAEDVMKHVYELKNIVYEVRGKINGQTLLPMPVGIERVHEVEQTIIESEGETVDLYLKSAIEGVIIKWAIQIDEVLKEDPSCAFAREVSPTPRFEIEFWNGRLKNLECIYDQLRDPRVKKMASILELTESAYFPCFKSLFRNIVAAVTEARDISLYLKPLIKHFDLIENTDFKDSEPLIRPLLHCVALVWTNSRYYCTSPKIINLMKEITNLLIQEAMKFLDPGSLFQGEVDETREHVEKCINIFKFYRDTFEEYRHNLASFFPEGVEPVPWTFHPRTVFEREIKFIQRLTLIEDFFATSMEFLKLEKVEIGGWKGRPLSTKVVEVLNEFNNAFTVLGNITYDPLDPEDESFENDYNTFMIKIEDLDRKLAAIFCQAFDDCFNLESLYKLIYIGGSLLDRPIIKEHVTPKYKAIIMYMAEELDTVKAIYDEQEEYYDINGYFHIDLNLPPTAGALMWMNKLRKRLSVSFEIIKDLEIDIVQSADFKYQINKYDQMLKYLNDLEDKVFDEWAAKVPEQCSRNLQKTILLQDPETLELSLNFDDELVAILKEVRYMKMMEKEGIPQEALDLFDRFETLHLWVSNLNLCIEWYNNIRQNSLPIEFELIAHEVEAIDVLLKEIVENLNWNSEDVWTYIEKIRELVEDLQVRVLEAQQNVDTIHELINSWSLTPLFERKDGKKENLIYLDDRADRVSRRYIEVKSAGMEIHRLMDENYRLFFNIKLPEPVVEEEEVAERRGGDEGEEGGEYEDELGEAVYEEPPMEPIDDEPPPPEVLIPPPVQHEVQMAPIEESAEGASVELSESKAGLELTESKRTVPTVAVSGTGVGIPTASATGVGIPTTSATGVGIPTASATGVGIPTASATGVGIPSASATGVGIAAISGTGIGTALSAVTIPPLAEAPTVEESEESEPPEQKTEIELFLESLRVAGLEPESDAEEEAEEEGEYGTQGLLFPSAEYPPLEPEMQTKWEAYVEYVDDIVADGLCNAVACSLSLFMDEMDVSNNSLPLFLVQLVLQEPDITFFPSLQPEDPRGFYRLVDNLINDIMKMADLVPRVARHIGQRNYKRDVENNEDLKEMSTETLSRVKLTMTSATEYAKTFDPYSYLWLDDRRSYLKQFLTYGHQLTAEELDILEATQNNEELPGLKETPPTIQQFKEQIDHYVELYKYFEDKIVDEKVFDNWMIVDVRPFKQALLNTVCKWSNLFKQHLVDQVNNSLQELEDFIIEADKALLTPVEEGDYEGLLKVMGYLYKVRERSLKTDEMFEPLKEIMDMLKAYDVEFSEETYLQLQELPDKWNNTKKIAITVKQNVAPLMANEANRIRKRLTYFDLRQAQYRDTFRKSPLFRFDCESVYPTLDKTNETITAFEKEMAELQEQASLFDVNVPDFKQLKFCRKEIKMLKTLWDYVSVVKSCINEWKKTPWKKIDVENMDNECKKYGKEIRGLDKEMRGWDTYINLEAMIKNLLTSLRAVTELQNPAIRERHWQQLMQATKVKFVMDDSTTLSDLLALNLHEYEDEVKNIVDKSVKEMSMEKILKELNATWSNMVFDKEVHPRTNTTVIRASEELIETLEENQVALQNLMSSKYIAYFLEEVSDWQRKLSNADQVIQVWFEVQRAWMHLESIFIGSEDIRRQLPEDSKRFDSIDKQFRALLEDMVKTLNVVQATNKPGLFEKLEELQNQLTVCEKALAEYLETKRLAYPRFYFISSVDLLDILSNGNQPELVARHLTKLYDSLAKLKFDQQGGKNTKNANAMWAKDGEFVKFNGICDCSGKVEAWLNRVTDTMRRTVRYYFGEALVTYEDSPREKWIFDYPAQVSLCGTQIWWTTEVNIAFAHLDEGYENAIKDYNRKQITQLNTLISLLLGDLTNEDRQKIMTICTIDVHSRDVVAKMIVAKVDNAAAFQWQSQLRHRWDEKAADCFCNICDAQFRYAHEYLGNTPRLVITPLTDRCYITLTQSLHLMMGGAPAGPAGTGKTETTKDLGRAMGIMVYVFNCSEQMDYKSCENVYKGLAQTGAWGCFDEFNRISVEVLSVVAVQVKTVLDAIKNKKVKFNFFGAMINLVPTVGLFITMNPGYAGRAELPENLKALFRPCAMVVPDFALISEIMLVAEGFQEARLLARKFITLYTLCKELLSKQDHYDWGLRAIKSVLVVAGALKRGDRGRPEDQVLMRALRDFNIPKIVTDDVPVFMDLIGDLFPALDVPRKRDVDFEKMIKQASLDLQLQPEDNFILKIVQLEELLAVRHSVFIIGNAGTGKTMVWRTLFKTYQNQKRKPVYNDLNPKAVTNNELFGIINPATREWKDGLIPVLFRDQANMSGDGPKWIMLDGDIDPMWIESLNTVMDDNKVLTLASNERIALTKMMRLIFEIASLRSATPATVSRAGILYINPQDLGWNPFVTSWIDRREQQSEKANLTILFDKYVPPCLEVCRTRFKKITPIPEISHIQMLCHLLDCLLIPNNVPVDCPKEWYEIYFVFACVWAFGAAMFQDQIVDWRVEFTKWWTNEFKTVKFPSQGTVFNYYIEDESKRFNSWNDLVKTFELDYDIPLQASLVSTSDTTCIRYFMDMLMEKKLPVMLVGTAGTGKSVMVTEKLLSLPETYAVTNVPFNFYTTSEMLQRVLEKPLEKKAGRNFGPPGNKTMVYFVDDMNMPEVDLYGTVQPHTLIRQYMDYGHWYDRIKLQLKEIHNCQFVSCMNPTAGSFTINPRLQRHFCVFAVNFPTQEPLTRIYTQILLQHLENPNLKFLPILARVAPLLVTTALQLHQKVSQMFLPTAVKFHYIFNLRDLSNIFQGILYTIAETLPNPTAFVRIWVHEANRVYGDKLISETDIDSFNKLVIEVYKKAGFEDIDDSDVFEKPIIYCHFSEGIGENKYLPISSWDHLSKLLDEGLSQYNDLVAAMNLVLFEDAMHHVCRINRILEGPRGNALLVGVGGSGKQSLSRLSAFISSLEVFQIQLRKGYTIQDMKTDLSGLYSKAGLKSIGIVFLMTDAQVTEERFLVLVNDMLASGEIPELYADDEVDNIVNALRNEVKSFGLEDTKENCWRFFIDRVRRQMKIVLCFSPVGSTLRIRSRKFPAITNCTAINWFHEWPHEALESVSAKFLQDIEDLPEQLQRSVSLFMSYVHSSVNDMSKVYLENEKRYNYTTPKTFLEQINLYGKLLGEKTNDLKSRIVRLVNGLEKLKTTAAQVDDLKVVLAEQEIELNEKNVAADQLIQVVGIETEKVSKEKAFAAEEEKKVRVIEEDVTVKQKVCAEDLRKAEPALIAAQQALNTLNKTNLTELKSFGSPPPAVVNVTAAVLVLFSLKGRIPKDRSWKACKLMMGKVDAFLDNLINYAKEDIQPEVYKAVMQYIVDPEFKPEKVLSKSFAASGLCAWVINIVKFYDVFVVVEPKRRALNQANMELKAARERLMFLNTQIASLEEQLAVLTAEFQEATDAKLKCQAEADATAYTIDLANRLVNGLASESVRWRQSVKDYKDQLVTLPGDILMVTAFVSYVGCFTRAYRTDLQHKQWEPFIKKLVPAIPMTPDVDPMDLLTDDAQIAQWNNEGLPNDRMSAENATVLTNSERWPLMIDPQLQGIKWIKNKYGSDLKVIRLAHKNYLDVIENALSEGLTVLLEYIGESVDAVLDPLLGRNLIKKGRAIKIGDKEMDFNPKFRLILQTKLANPHYKPEMQAQTTLINFTVTRDGLEEQLLAEVVKAERPDLEKLRTSLTKQQNDYKIKLKVLEDDLLTRLANAGEDILSDTALVINLETTKKTADEIEIKVEEAKITSKQIDEAREQYRSAAARASLLYFILNDLYKINPIYQFSLKAFSVVFQNAIHRTEKGGTLQQHVANLLDSITFMVFMYTSRGLFECDKLIFLAQMAFQILVSSGDVNPAELDFLLRFPFTPNLTSPVDFLTNVGWGGIKSLSQMLEFKNLDRDIEGSAKRWKKFVESEYPEKEKFPQEWKNKSALQKLCMMRALRPDRMTYAIKAFVEEKLGSKFIESRSIEFAKSFEETSPTTPVFFILSPGVDPLKDVEKLGKKLGFTSEKRNFHNVSLGQGQEVVAENAMEVSSKYGHWVILQNIHLVQAWLPNLEKKMEQCEEGAHPKYRLFISAEPAPAPELHIIPQGLLESSIKITNEPPSGMMANLHKALDNFTQETLEMCTKEFEFKAILFVLCYFHAVVNERRKFGAQGWNRSYPFNVGDLTISVNVLYNYLENCTKIPWEDLRYLFGEIMYGGHITDDWDRRLCRTFLEEWLKDELMDGDVLLAPGFPAPGNMDYVGYCAYIDDSLPTETPYLYGLHPNAEIGFLTTSSENLFRTVFEMQPRDAGAGGGATVTREEKVKFALEEIMDKVPEPFNIQEIMAKVEERTPYIIVAFQECERMNNLMGELRRSLKELDLGLKGELTITQEMEALEGCLFLDQVPPKWTAKAYPSMLTLGPWFADLLLRLKELEAWSADFNLPATVWLAGFFNPQSFLTAIMQSTARKNEWPLDKMCLHCDVSKKQKDDITSAPREGAYVHGLYMEGARWDTQTGSIVESRLKELFPQMPVIFIKAITQDKQDLRNVYECPVYKTRIRGPTFVWTFNLKTKEKAAKWTMAGVAILLQM